ncbi:hypothetical protein Cst_c07120 [Thermoclostridium stercorarium subsp. stercorarium DSM 8532]|uniref:Uncharacterized protein n=1 Tax=Thermoclostridium stercorarium (strain ATCC 35414 / DSM 8532 / NCIMB 11754) TaxID=1121335 RepID=L7VQ79_THES1|nr:hypothetical protein Cst_c07120 [Thermoclostridium stercorarium subsp. stercorarium DSM 8532]
MCRPAICLTAGIISTEREVLRPVAFRCCRHRGNNIKIKLFGI